MLLPLGTKIGLLSEKRSKLILLTFQAKKSVNNFYFELDFIISQRNTNYGFEGHKLEWMQPALTSRDH